MNGAKTPLPEMLRAQARLLEAMAETLERTQAAVEIYSQEQLPAWASSKNTYLAACRELAREGHPGVSRVGKRVLMTAAASSEWVSRQSKRRRPVLRVVSSPATDPANALRASLGLRVVHRGAEASPK